MYGEHEHQSFDFYKLESYLNKNLLIEKPEKKASDLVYDYSDSSDNILQGDNNTTFVI
jgi:hypothetical protein